MLPATSHVRTPDAWCSDNAPMPMSTVSLTDSCGSAWKPAPETSPALLRWLLRRNSRSSSAAAADSSLYSASSWHLSVQAWTCRPSLHDLTRRQHDWLALEEDAVVRGAH